MRTDLTVACEKAKYRLIQLGYKPYITEIVDIGDRWLFFSDIGGGADYGNNPVIVSKDTGEVEDFYLGDPVNYSLYEKGADVDIPEEFKSLTAKQIKELNRELKERANAVPGAYDAMVKMVYATAKKYGLQQKIIDYIDRIHPDDVDLLKFLDSINPAIPKDEPREG